ncbi:hypothetical protein HY948_03155 [Candidatus Gottesmanbacteria bacterium]|nr:hypothetical protein [Candidatus Gottesmanbacteria bacterium]
MLQTTEHSFHRGDRDIQWYMQNAFDLEIAMHSVAQEIIRGLRLKSSHIIFHPPDPYCTEEDQLVTEIIQQELAAQNDHIASSGDIFVVAWSLTVPTAAISVQTIHHQYAQYGTKLRGIGCGALMVPTEHQGEYKLFSDQDWIQAIKPVPFIPLYRCSAHPEDCLQ